MHNRIIVLYRASTGDTLAFNENLFDGIFKI